MTTAQVLALQAIPWAWNYYVRDADFAHISPASWRRNMEMGFEWDPNNFGTNMWAHPAHGNLYFNAARNNGFDFWGSAAITFAGSFVWEVYGETHRPAINDWVATSVGGITLGEALNRVAVLIQNNQKTGAQRVLREVTSGLLNPMSGFNRLIRGESWRIGPNPSNRKPSPFNTDIDLGVRMVAPGNLGTETLRTGYVQADVYYGSSLMDTRHPFDSFRFALQLNVAPKPVLGRLQISGNVWGQGLKRSGTSRHTFTLSLDYDYVNHETFEVGDQSIGVGFYSFFPMSERVHLGTRFRVNGILLGAVNSEFAQASGRDYDFGTGFALKAGVQLIVNGHEWVTAFYDGAWLHALNGSEADHLLHVSGVELLVPVRGTASIGAEFFIFARNSYYDQFGSVHRRNPTFRTYASFRVSSF